MNNVPVSSIAIAATLTSPLVEIILSIVVCLFFKLSILTCLRTRHYYCCCYYVLLTPTTPTPFIPFITT